MLDSMKLVSVEEGRNGNLSRRDFLKKVGLGLGLGLGVVGATALDVNKALGEGLSEAEIAEIVAEMGNIIFKDEASIKKYMARVGLPVEVQERLLSAPLKKGQSEIVFSDIVNPELIRKIVDTYSSN